jgi:hypothetical protein
MIDSIFHTFLVLIISMACWCLLVAVDKYVDLEEWFIWLLSYAGAGFFISGLARIWL